MASGPESRLVARMVKRINQLDCPSRARKVHGGAYGTGGEPDIDAVLFGRSLKVEVKTPGNKPTDRQAAVIRQWADAGATAGWCDSMEGLDRLIASCLRSSGDGRAEDLADQIDPDRG